MRTRLQPSDRKELIIEAALRVASRPGGWSTMTREAVAKAAEVSDGLVSMHFGTMVQFRRSVMRAAVSREVLPVIAQGVVMGDKTALKADASLKTKAIESLNA